MQVRCEEPSPARERLYKAGWFPSLAIGQRVPTSPRLVVQGLCVRLFAQLYTDQKMPACMQAFPHPSPILCYYSHQSTNSRNPLVHGSPPWSQPTTAITCCVSP